MVIVRWRAGDGLERLDLVLEFGALLVVWAEARTGPQEWFRPEVSKSTTKVIGRADHESVELAKCGGARPHRSFAGG